jgi:mRNA deadenylase 3'-5' endonuclease subunit Ccr4
LPFTALTYNVLADGYIRREWYPYTPEAWLDPRQRHPALAEHVAALDAGIVCLQEVEAPMYAAIGERLSRASYAGELALKGHGKPDGCATFWRGAEFELVSCRRLEYSDGAGARSASGHIAQLTVLRAGPHLLGIANTHLKFDPPSALRARRYALAQIAELVNACAATHPACAAWIICGDFNLTPQDPVVATLRAAGYQFAHDTHPQTPTAAPNRRPKMIDYLFHTSSLAATPIMPPAIDGQTPMPGPGHPSDHLALAARFDWV